MLRPVAWILGSMLVCGPSCNALWGLSALDYDGTSSASGAGAGAGGAGARGGGGGSVGGTGGTGGTSAGGGGAGGTGGGACTLGPFGAPTNVSEVNSSYADSHPWISADGRTLYFASTRPGTTTALDLWVATRSSSQGAFDEPQRLPDTLNSAENDGRPTVSADELELYFYSERAGGLGHADLWRAARVSTSEAFGTAAFVSALSSAASDYDPGLSVDGLTLYFVSNRPDVANSTDLWIATRPSTQASFDVVGVVADLSSTGTEAQPWLSADGLRLYFASDRTGGLGSQDLWGATRPSAEAAFEPAEPLAELNTVADDWGPSLSLDERTIYFYSSREGGLGSSDIWQATRGCLGP